MAAPAWTRPGLLRAWLLGTTALLPAATGASAQGIAPNTLPTGGQVSAGTASISQSGNAMQVTQGSNRAAINWQGFNVGANASVHFQQPGAGSWTLNRVTGADPSVIAGRVTANGGVAIVNQSGVVFAAGAQVNVGSLIASAANITNENFMAGKMVFDGPPRPGATVENHGSITIADRGLAALVGPRVANSGTIRARLGRVALAGAETFSLDLAGDGLLSIDVTQAVRTAAGGGAALVTNSGVIEAQGGSVLLSAHAASGLVEDLVRHTGSIAANSAAGRGGQVALRAEGGGVRVDGSISATGRGRQAGGSIAVRGSTATTIAGTARLDASGGAGGGTVLVGTTGVGRNQAMSAATTVERGARISADARRRGDGGTIAVNSTTSTNAQGRFSARGGRQGGNGGLVELSGQRALSIAAQVDVKAPAGRNGTILLDPTSIEVVADADAPADAGAPLATVTANTGASGTVLKIRASDLDAAAASVTLQAAETITIGAAVNLGANTLNLFADGAITQTGAGTITAGTLVIRGFGGGSSAAGSATLNLANSIAALDAVVTGTLLLNNGGTPLAVTRAQGSTVTLATTGTIDLNGAVGGSGAAVFLHADGTINQNGGSITAAGLTVRNSSGAAATAGDVNLGQTNSLNAIDIASTSSLTLVNDGTALSVAGLAAPVATLATGGDIAFTGPTQVSSTLTLQTNGSVSQSGAGSIGTGLLNVTDRANSGATPGAVALGTLTNAINAIDIRATGAVAVNNGGTPLLLTRATGSSIAIIAGALTVPGTAVVQAAAGGTIALRVDSLAWGGLLDAGTTGTLEIGPRSTASTVSLGAGGAAALQVDPGSFDASRLIAGTFTVGETTIGASTVRGNGLVVSGPVAPDAAAVATALRLVADAGTAISVEAPLTLADRAVSLLGSGSIGQTAAGRITAAALTVGAPGGGNAGAVTLNAVANALGRAGIASSGTVLLANDATPLTLGGLSGTGATITTAGTLAIDGAIGLGAGMLTLFSDGAISQTGGVVTAGSLVVRNAAGAAATPQSVALDGADNAIAAIDIAATGSVAVRNGATDLAVTALSGSGATLTTGGALSFNGAADLGAGTLTLRAGGAVTQANTAAITAGTLNTRDASGNTAAAAVTLDAADNAIGSLDGATTAAYALRTSAALTVTGLRAQSAVLTSGTSIGISGAVTVTDGLALNAPAMSSTAVITAATLTLRGADGSAAASGALDFSTVENAVGALDAKSATSIQLRNGTTALLVTQAAAPLVLLQGRGALTLDGAIGGSGATVTLAALGDLVQTGGIITAATLSASATNAGLDLQRANAVASASLTAGTTLDFASASALTVTGASGTAVTLAAPSIALAGAVDATTSLALTTTAGAITQTAAGAITTPRLAAVAVGGGISLDAASDAAAGNAIARLGASASGGGISVFSRTAMEVHAAGIGVTASAGSTIALAAPSLAVNQALGFAAPDAGNRITLTADALTATAAIDAGPTGQVAIQPRAASRGIDIGGATGNTLQLGAATLGHVTAGRLLISAAGTTAIGLNADLVLAGVGTLELIAGTGITQNDATGITVARLSATATAGSIDLGGANQIGAIAGSTLDSTIGLSATGGITLVNAAALAVDAKVVAGNARTIAITATDLTTSAGIATTGSSAGNRIDLRADTVVLGGDVSATDGVINILPRTSGRAVRLGGADGVIANTLTLPTSQFRFIQAGSGMLRIGGTDATTTAGRITLGGEVPLRASVSGGAVVGGSAATLDLRAAEVATDPGVVFGLNVGNLTGTTSAGFRLNGPGNAIDTLGAISGNTVAVSSDLALTANGPIDGGPGRVVLGSAGQLTLAGDLLAGTGVVLAADAAILQTGGRIAAPVVEAGGFNAGATAVSLLRAANDFGAVAAEASGAVRIFSTAATAGTLSLAGPVTGASVGITSGGSLDSSGGGITATGGAIALTATGTITLGNSLLASGDVTLLANAAAGVSAITQTAGSIQSGAANTISLTADGITLLAAANSIRTGAAGTGGLVLLRPLTDGRAITLGGLLANTLSIASGAGISAGRVLIGRTEAGPITVAGSFGVGGATLELITGGAITQAGGTVLTAAGLSATAGGAMTLDGQNQIEAVVGSTADPARGLTSGGSIALTTARAGGLTTSAAIAAADGASVTLRADALALGATVGAGSGNLAALNILPNTVGTAVTLGADAAGLALDAAEIGFLRAGTGLLRFGGDGSGVTAGAITIAGDLRLRGGSASAAVLDLRGDSVAQTGGVVAVATLTGASAAGGFVLDGANQIDSLGLAGAGNTLAVSATGGAVAIASVNALTVRGNVTAAAAAGSGTAGVSLRGNGLTIGDDAAPAKPVLVQAGRGDLVLDAGGGALVTTATTTLRAQDPASLTAEGTLGDAFGTIRLGGGTVTLAGTLDAGRAGGGRDIRISSSGALDVGTASLTARRDIGLTSTASGATVQSGATLAAGRDIALTGFGTVRTDGTLTAGRSIGVGSTGGTVTMAGTATAATLGPVLADPDAGITVSGLGDVSLDGSLTATGRSILATATTGTLTVNGALAAATGGGITLNATGADGRVVIAATGTLDGGTVTINAGRQLRHSGRIGGSDITLTVGPNGAPLSPAFEATSGSSIIAGGALAIAAQSGNIGLTGATLQAGTTLGIAALAGSITQTGGSTTAAGAVTFQAATGIGVTNGGGTAPQVGSTGGSLAFTTGTGDLVLTEAGITAGGTLGLTATAGAIRQTGGTTSGAGDVTLRAGTDIVIAQGSALGPAVVTGLDTLPVLRSTGAALGVSAVAGDIALTHATVGAGTTLGLTASLGGLTQTGGSITAGSTLSLTSGGDTVQRDGGRIIAPVLTGAAGGSVSLINGITLPGALVAKASGNSIAAIAGYTAGGDLTLASTATPLRITGLVSAGAGRALRLFADDYALAAGLAAPSGSVTLSPYTRDGSIALVLGGPAGASAANTLTLDSAELDLLPPGGIGTLRFGSRDNPAGLTDIASVTIAGAADLGTGAGTRVGRLELDTRGAITQDAGTSLIVPLLTATAGGNISLDPGSSANRIGGLAGLRTPGSVSLRTALVAGAPLAIGAGSFAEGIRVGSGQAITLRADDIDIAAAVRAPGGSITLMADTGGRGITLGGAAAGTLSLSAAELLLLGGEGGGALASGAATLLRIDATTVPGDVTIAGPVDLQGPTARFQALELLAAGTVAGSGGAITVPVLRATVAGDLVLDNAGNSFLLNRITAANATIRQAGDLRLANAVAAIGGVDAPGGIAAAGTLRLIAGGGITQDGGAIIEAGTLALAAGNTVTLTEANAFGTLADVGILGGGTSRIRAANATVAGPVSVTDGLSLLGDAGLGVTGSIATGGALALETTRGDIVLGGATLTVGGGLALTAGSGASAGGDITITGGSIGVTGAAVLTATRDGTPANPGDITLNGTAITAGAALTLAAGGGIGAGGSTLAATGAFAATAATGGIGFTGTTASGSTATLAAATGLTVTGGGLAAQGGALQAGTATGDLALDGAGVTAAGSLGLTASSGRITQRRGSTTGGGDVTLSGGSGIAVTSDGGAAPILRSTGGALAATSASGDIGLAGATLSAATGLGLTAGAGAITIATSTLAAGTGAALAAGTGIAASGSSLATGSGAMSLTATGGGITLAGTTLAAATSQALQAGGGITLTDSRLTAGGSQALTAVGMLAATGSSLTAAGNQAFAAGTGLTLTGTTASTQGSLAATTSLGAAALTDATLAAAGTLSLTAAAGAVTQTRGSITGGGETRLRGATGITVTDAGSGTAPILRSSGGSLGLLAEAGNVVLANARLAAASGIGIAAGGGIGATGSSLATAGGTLGLAAATGDLILLRSSLASSAGDIDLTAGGAGSLTTTGLAAASPGGRVRVVSGGPLTLRALSVSADVADFEAGRLFPADPAAYGQTRGSGLLLNDGITAGIGTKLLFAGPGGITDLGLTLVLPRASALPAVIYDTRLNPATNPLGQVRPDIAGLPANQQATQVRSAPGALSPGAFGLPDQATAAGAAAININAGRSAVFLLVDGGAIQGNIVAGRLGVHGAGGGMSLFGTLDGSTGAQAARFADITRPIAANELQRYRINGCVISSVNCVVPPSIQIIPPRPSDRAPFRIENNRINTSEVLIPNIAEEDDDE